MQKKLWASAVQSLEAAYCLCVHAYVCTFVCMCTCVCVRLCICTGFPKNFNLLHLSTKGAASPTVHLLQKPWKISYLQWHIQNLRPWVIPTKKKVIHIAVWTRRLMLVINFKTQTVTRIKTHRWNSVSLSHAPSTNCRSFHVQFLAGSMPYMAQYSIFIHKIILPANKTFGWLSGTETWSVRPRLSMSIVGWWDKTIIVLF